VSIKPSSYSILTLINDIAGLNKKTSERLGISVKSRSRQVDKFVAGIDIGGITIINL